MDFTPAQISIIEKLIDDRIAAINAPSAFHGKNYHRIPEIRSLIQTHIEDIKKEIPDSEFDINVFRFVLKKYTTLRPGDKALFPRDNVSRWDRQVVNAIHPTHWPNSSCPIEACPGPSRGKYRFRNTVTTLFDQ